MRTGMARAQDGTTRLRAAAGTTRLRAAAGTARRRAVDMDQTICPACMLPATWPAPSTVPETGITVSRLPEMTATEAQANNGNLVGVITHASGYPPMPDNG